VLRSEYRRVGREYGHPGQAIDVRAVVWFELLKTGKASKTGGVRSALTLLDMKFEGERHRALDDAVMEAKMLQRVAGVAPTS